MMRLKQIISRLLIIALVFEAVVMEPIRAEAGEVWDAAAIYQVGEDIIACMAGGSQSLLFTDDFCAGAGSSVNDWLAIGAMRLGLQEAPDLYLAGLEKAVQNMYDGGNLSAKKATEWHRMSIALLSLGADPTAVNGRIDLIADGTYQHAVYGSLGRQGLNGWCWALIALDASDAAVPTDADYTREMMITEILSAQLGNGAFSLAGMGADVDMTAMVLQALAPYYEDGNIYVYENQGEQVRRSVKECVDKALLWLSGVQCDDGSFESYGNRNAESTAQVIIALTSLEIDPQADERFLKASGTAVDGLMQFQMPDGGFAHVLSEEQNKNHTNGLASAQSLCAVAALYRYMTGQSSLYDFETGTHTAPPEQGEQNTLAEDTTEAHGQQDETYRETDVFQEQQQPDTERALEMQETLDIVPEEEQHQPDNMIYGIAGFVVAVGIIIYLVMRKYGRTEN